MTREINKTRILNAFIIMSLLTALIIAIYNRTETTNEDLSIATLVFLSITVILLIIKGCFYSEN
jgi:hypothetical protein